MRNKIKALHAVRPLSRPQISTGNFIAVEIGSVGVSLEHDIRMIRGRDGMIQTGEDTLKLKGPVSIWELWQYHNMGSPARYSH